ncbi:ABC transporter substrate-binding protein [Paenibacillus radicis (ex Xue et al. 2023)]|uniref:ABC transporter substrate-binding protein n=1 Tax=Paenibacillus radicis (ex Xue et al. 2023) TaxID=2972489 RepID=A0ABT1YKG8_9BACL|nr:ABC transporter substrate-binding protein [Paenibacillus radicis (ex Xue et al. 2023)]MCR8632879.1 ABC transporter substrate-binding protein [Paenibacillus radicis (ex Xue et al. 2023)]
MKRNYFWAIIFVLATSLLITGCGKDKPTTNNSAAVPKTGGNLNISLNADPPKLDPTFSTALIERQVFSSLFDKLLDLNPDGTFLPQLAVSWTISEDQKTYTFKLREGVKFHDGTDFNADAVKFTFDRNLDKSSPRLSELNEVDKFSVVDPYTIKIELKKPFSPFLSVLTDRAGMILSPAAVKQYGEDFLNHPVGTGPFVFKERVKGDHIVLVKNENYWQKGLPKVDSLTYKVITDTNIAFMNLKSGQIDITNKFPEKEVTGVKNDPKISVINELTYAYQGIYLNVSKPPFDKKELRQAVDLLIDRDAIVKVLLNDIGAPAHSPFAPGQFAYGDSDKYQKPDLQKAKDLLTKAGMPDGFSFTLTISTSPANQQLGQMIQGMLKPAGIDVKLEKIEFGQLLEKLDKHNFEAVQNGWSGRPDPDQNIYRFVSTGQVNNYSVYSNKKVDELLNAARTESAIAKRKALYDDTMRILNDEIPEIFLYHEANLMGFSKEVKGFTYVPDGLIRTATLSK